MHEAESVFFEFSFGRSIERCSVNREVRVFKSSFVAVFVCMSHFVIFFVLRVLEMMREELLGVVYV